MRCLRERSELFCLQCEAQTIGRIRPTGSERGNPARGFSTSGKCLAEFFGAKSDKNWSAKHLLTKMPPESFKNDFYFYQIMAY